mmetsp:Transcript_18124/g.32221  ORF Transcript_18124/g.32221 Transcript_18124/m.32221 type:complete len:268 (+) Transcript_18124:1788-2591(+)
MRTLIASRDCRSDCSRSLVCVRLTRRGACITSKDFTRASSRFCISCRHWVTAISAPVTFCAKSASQARSFNCSKCCTSCTCRSCSWKCSVVLRTPASVSSQCCAKLASSLFTKPSNLPRRRSNLSLASAAAPAVPRCASHSLSRLRPNASHVSVKRAMSCPVCRCDLSILSESSCFKSLRAWVPPSQMDRSCPTSTVTCSSNPSIRLLSRWTPVLDSAMALSTWTLHAISSRLAMDVASSTTTISCLKSRWEACKLLWSPCNSWTCD